MARTKDEQRAADAAARKVKRADPAIRAARLAEGRRTRLAHYGLTPDDYRLRLKSQGGGCAICGRPPSSRRALDVDHEHQLGERQLTGAQRRPFVRGLLCAKHNRMLGFFPKDALEAAEIALAVARYFERYAGESE